MAAHSCARPFRLFHITSEVKLHFTEFLFPQQERRGDEIDRDRRQHGDVIGADAVCHRLGAVQAPMSMDVMSIAAWMNTVTQMFPVRKYTAASSVPSEAAKTHCIRTPSGSLPVRLVRWAAPK